MARNVAFYIFLSMFIIVFMLLFSVHVISVTHHEGFELQKIVSLLGLKRLKLSFHKEVVVVVHVHNYKLPLLSAPSPSPALAPPLSHTHPPFPFVPHGRSSGQKNDGGARSKRMRRRKMVLVAVFVSVGGVTLLILTGFVVVWFLRKLRRHGKSWPLTVVKGRRHSKHRSMHASSQTSIASSNVGLNPKLDLFHFHALNADLEQHPFSHSVSVTRIQNHQQQVGDDENVSCSVTSTREILSVHKSVDSIVGYETESIPSVSGCRHDTTDHNHHQSLSDEDESFHSVCASNSSSARLSSASISILNEPLVDSDTFSPHRDGVMPPPPPPPPPPPTFPQSNSFAHSNAKMGSSREVKVNICSDPSEVNATRHSLKPPPPPPLPPCIKAPPPLPVLSNFIPLGENGSPLPKLKPLHWDKVRAEPDKSMVWDKLKSSSFRY